jgi:NAD(P)H dehydrogenase (quinone)
MAGSEASARTLAALGAEPVVADFRKPDTVAAAMKGCERVFHIPPRMQPDELAISTGVIEAALGAGVRHLAVLSVVCPHLEDIVFHWTKMKVEAALFHHGQRLAYTILRPTNYMQNVEWQWELIEAGQFVLPYSAEVRLSWVDAEEVAEAAARILTEDGHERATYELAGRDSFLNRREMSERIGRALGREVRAVTQPLDEYMQLPRWRNRKPEEMQRLRTMFEHYERHGMPAGNSRTLSMLIGRPASSFDEFLERFVALKRGGGRAWNK